MNASILCVAVIGSLVMACDRRATTTAPSVVASETSEPTSWLSVSIEAPPVGTEIIVVGNAAASDSTGTFGSFRASLSYDRKRLEFVREEVLPGAMRAINPDSGRIIIAGATLGGFEEGKLFALRFKVLHLQPFETMSLKVDELNGVNYGNQVRLLKARATIVPDRSLRN